MTDSDQERLKGIFSWDNRNTVFRIRFVESEEFDMTISGWSQDIGEPPHCYGTVVGTLKSKRVWKEGSAMMFQLQDVEMVVDVETEEVLFKVE